jgi:nucleotide-binding universal stress UspA family protein
VLGSHGRTGFNRFFNGSVAEDVTRHSEVPVLIVPLKD